MIQVIALTTFYDFQVNWIRYEGEVFSVSKERFEELGTLIKEITLWK